MDEQSRQTLTVILKNYYGSFIQAYYLGSQVSIHQPTPAIEEGIRATIKNSLPSLELQSVTVSPNGQISISVSGFSDLAVYNFSLEDLEGGVEDR